VTLARRLAIMARAGSASRWGAWLGAPGAAGALAFLLGVTGILGRPAAPPTDLGLVGALAGGTPGLDCPGGERVAWFTVSERIFATARTPDGEYLAVRVPGKEYETAWIATAALKPDEETGFDGLPIGECIVPIVESGQP
jgi:hypothetical protein